MIRLFQIGHAKARPTIHFFGSADKLVSAAFAPKLSSVHCPGRIGHNVTTAQADLHALGAYDPGQVAVGHETLQPGVVLLEQLNNSIGDAQP